MNLVRFIVIRISPAQEANTAWHVRGAAKLIYSVQNSPAIYKVFLLFFFTGVFS
jgi:hypothetical protein